MPILISIPASEIVGLKKKVLVLDSSGSCSRCGAKPTDFYEVHRLNYRVGEHKNRLVGSKWRKSYEYRLKIAICETCYQSDFLTHPELLDHNGSQLSRIARLHSFSWTFGALITGLGFVLLTPIVSETAFFQPLRALWQLPVGLGVLVLLLTWFSQRKYQNKVLHELEKINLHFMPHSRAEVNSIKLDTEEDLSKIVLQIKMENEAWAEQVATARGWVYEKINTDIKPSPNQEK